MASHSDDESDLVSEETVRRTRSGRAVKVVAPVVAPAPRQTRGAKKKSASDVETDPVQIEEEAQPEVMEQQEIECTSDNSNGLSQFFPADELTPQFLEGASDSNQSGVPFPITEISQDFLNNTESNSQTPQIFTEKVFDASITEENANSFQSKMDVTCDDVVASEITQMNSDSNVANTGFDTLMEVTEVKEQEFKVEPSKVEEVTKVIIKEEDKPEVAVEIVVATPLAVVATPVAVVATPVAVVATPVAVVATPLAVVEDKDKVAQVVEEVKQDPDTEMVSEDELPAPVKAKVPEDAEEVSDDELPAPKRPVPDDAEEVSDDELPVPKNPVPEDAEDLSDDDLPGPKLAELPDDTEVVSEDELPTVKAGTKRKLSDGGGGYDPGSPTGEEGGSGDAPDSNSAKRPALDPEAMQGEKKEKDREGSGDSKEGDKDKEKKVKSSKPSRKTLPDLDKYWKAVNDDPADFTGWTYLLQYVDQENEIDPAREAYDAFLAHYPYCYGYWRKYADYEKRKGNKKKCEDVFERGLKAIPLSVDLWLHFLSYTRASYPEEETRIREQFERALSACSLEFRSDRLWEAYIKWELEGKRLVNVMAIYDRLLATPTFGYTGHFDSFQELVASHEPADLVPSTVFVELRKEVRDKKKETPIDTEAPPGEDEADDHVQNDEERDAIRELIITIRRKIHKATATEVTSRWTFEEGIKRPYFHVKPLERCQLTNWKDYLEFEAAQGNRQRVLVLYERCLIACALYEEFWLKLIRYLESQHDPMLVGHTRDVFERACTVHHPDKPSLHLLWAAFEEGQGNYPKAAEILVNLEKTCPSLLQVAYRRINLERRKGDLEKCCQLFETYISSHKSKVIVGGLVIKYARFCHKIRGDLAKGLQVIKAGIEKDPGNARLYLQAIDLAMQREKIDAAEIVEFMDSFLAREPDVEQRILFAQRKLEFLEDFGTAEGLQEALRGLQQALSKSKGKKDKGESSPSKKPKDGSLSSGSNPPLPPSNYQNSGASNQSYGGSYNNSGNQGGPQQGSGGPYSSSYGPTGYNQQYPQSSGEYPPYQWGQYSQAPYNNYGQWGSYPNYY